MRRLDWTLIILLIIGIFASKVYSSNVQNRDTVNPRRPSVQHFTPDVWDAETRAWLTKSPTPQKGQPLSGNRLRNGVIENSGINHSSVGSAFSVSSDGVWLTARHVVEGCSKIAIQTATQGYLRVNKTVQHPTADVALILTNGGPERLLIANQKVSWRDGYNIGFPAGQPGAVHTRFMGDLTIRHVNRRQPQKGYRERVNAWAERSRIPDRSGSLGGLSGGAVLDGRGKVIGIVQAESARRGRVMTARPATIRDLFSVAKVDFPSPSNPSSGLSLSERTYPKIARNLITSLRVAKVFCLVE